MNPFERHDLDPRAGIQAITARLKELAEDARSDAEREAIRRDWEELTLHPARRVRAALFTWPETRPELGRPPAPRRDRAPEATLDLRDLAALPEVSRTLGEPAPPPLLEALADDPILNDPRP